MIDHQIRHPGGRISTRVRKFPPAGPSGPHVTVGATSVQHGAAVKVECGHDSTPALEIAITRAGPYRGSQDHPNATARPSALPRSQAHDSKERPGRGAGAWCPP